jgi:hypothetical protein
MATAKKQAAPDPGAAGTITPKGPKKRQRKGLRMRIYPDGGMSIRHLRTDPDMPIRLCSEAITASDAAGPVWNQIAKPGKFLGHAAGAFELNDQVFREIIANFEATQNRLVPVDYEHASEADATSGTIPFTGAPAQAWVKALEIRDGKLWGLFDDWKPAAREEVRSGGYKFLSPAVRFGCRDRVTGKPIGARLSSVALTNNPFLDGMQPLVARDNGGGGDGEASVSMGYMAYDADDLLPPLRAALGLSEDDDVYQVQAAVKRASASLRAADWDLDSTVDGLVLADVLPALRDLVNPGIDATWWDVFDKLDSLICSAVYAHEDALRAAVVPPPASSSALTLTAGRAGKDPGMATNGTAPQDPTSRLLADRDAQVVTLRDEVRTLSEKLAKAEADLATEKSIGTALRSELQTLADQAATDDAKSALLTYGPSRNLGPDALPHLLSHRKADAAGFAALYPKVAPENQHLLRNLTGNANNGGNAGASNGAVVTLSDVRPSAGNMAGGAVKLSALAAGEVMVQMAADLRKANPSLDYAQSLIDAERAMKSAGKVA